MKGWIVVVALLIFITMLGLPAEERSHEVMLWS